ncbi:MAG: helix-turn-helix transcriptional regulator [Clostridia bacterium]|nr:helix-turn-helix transcriptional regulator [Clostridia bacterium]
MENKASSPFARRLVKLRKERGMRQEDVAKALQIHRTTYTKYETDVTTPDPAGLLRLAALFGVSVDCLVGRETQPTPAEGVLRDGGAVWQLDSQEQQLLVLFRRLNDEQRETVLYRLDEESRKDDR